jgi:membrane-associated protease RseP (regulator of RpoE activity)
MKCFMAAVLVLLVGLPVRAGEGPKEARPVVVPFELLASKHMAVKIKVNGKGPYRVIFDTGAPVTVLSNAVAKEAGLPRGKGFFGAGTAPVELKELQVGDLKAAKVSAVVMDHPTVQAMAEVLGPIEGIVGFPFFARYKVVLDYQAKTMTFTPNGFDPPDVVKAMEAAMEGALGGKQEAKVLAPAAQWGLVAEKARGDEEAGVTIRNVLPGGAAAAAGLKAGDRLLTLDGRWTDSIADLYTAAGFVKPGIAVKLVVTRANKEMTFTVTPTAGL